MIEGPRLDSVRRLLVLCAQAIRLELFQKAGTRVENTNVGAIELVGGAEQKVRIQGLDINREMRSIVDRVHHQQSTDFSAELAN